jgi:glycosyltransferase involved in cell wall biosynthesis
MSARRLCIVNPFQHGGGAEYQIACLVDSLAPLQRYEISYLAHNTDSSLAHEHYRLVQIGRNGRIPRLGYLMDALPLYRALRAIRPHVIYQRVAGGYTGICAHYARCNRVPMVWHISSDSDVSRDSGFYGRNPLRRLMDRYSIDYGIRHATAIVAQTEDQRQQLLDNHWRAATQVIPNFHPLPQEPLDKSGPLTVLWVANIKPLKRPEVFVRLAAALADLAEVRFVMIGSPASGSGDREWGARLMQSIDALPNLSFLGRLSQSEVNGWLARSHLFVNTSDVEGFPNTFIQAWMREVPVLSLDINPDKVLDGKKTAC